ncbi:MAG: hypothetical protein JXA92_07215 [candidate division Zixibacteria bacterium]|nr:hypothetical protein [candidate division Zixibacteria bacterium]
MKFTAKILILAFIFLLPLSALAQVDSLGKTDTLYADIAKLNETTWTVTLSFVNDEPLIGMALPFRLTAGLNRIVVDSVVYGGVAVKHDKDSDILFTGGTSRGVDQFAYKNMRVDTAIQCVTLGLIANLGPTKNQLSAGSGPIATLFVSSLEDKPIEKLNIDTTTTHPNNSLMVIADQLQGTPPDTVRIEMSKATIIPAFVVREPKKK